MVISCSPHHLLVFGRIQFLENLDGDSVIFYLLKRFHRSLNWRVIERSRLYTYFTHCWVLLSVQSINRRINPLLFRSYLGQLFNRSIQLFLINNIWCTSQVFKIIIIRRGHMIVHFLLQLTLFCFNHKFYVNTIIIWWILAETYFCRSKSTPFF